MAVTSTQAVDARNVRLGCGGDVEVLANSVRSPGDLALAEETALRVRRSGLSQSHSR